MRWIPRRKALRWAEVAMAIGFAVVLARYRHAHSAQASAPEPSAAPSVQVDSTRQLRVTGSLAALHSAMLLAPRVQGSRSGLNRGGSGAAGGGSDFNLILMNLAKPGAHVKAGDVVAQFDTQFQSQRLDDYRDTVVQLEANLKTMRETLAATKETHDQTVRQAKADWEESQLDAGKIPILADIDAEKQKLAVEEAQATYKQLSYESPLVEEQQVDQIRVAELNLEQSRLELKRAEANVAVMTVHAPIDGVVLMPTIVRNGEVGQIREGDQVNAGQPFMYVVDPSAMVLNAMVNQVDAERLRLGMTAKILVDAYPDCVLDGKLTGVGAMAQTSTFRASYVSAIPVRLSIARLDPRIIPDLTASAEIDMRSGQ